MIKYMGRGQTNTQTNKHTNTQTDQHHDLDRPKGRAE